MYILSERVWRRQSISYELISYKLCRVHETYPLQESASQVLAVTKTRGVGASREADRGGVRSIEE
jgi:hypothetical protein